MEFLVFWQDPFSYDHGKPVAVCDTTPVLVARRHDLNLLMSPTLRHVRADGRRGAKVSRAEIDLRPGDVVVCW